MRERLIELLEEAKIQARATIGSLNNGFGEWYADYLLANGVIVPPCKVGGTVYIIDEAEDECSEDYVLDVKVNQFIINKHGIAVDLELPLGLRLNTWAVIGKTVFLTREEAEQKLKEGKG